MSYRESLALGGTDIRSMVCDFEAWWFDRKLKESGTVLPWLQKEPSPAAQFGTAVHMALLEPDRYDEFSVIMSYCDNFALKEGRSIKIQAQEKCTTPEHFIMRFEHDWAIAQIRKNFFFGLTKASLEMPKESEVELEYYETRDGIDCKGKLDWLYKDTVIDLKTVSDINRISDIKYQNAYHAQLAHYAQLAKVDKTTIIWIESAAPFRVIIESLNEEDRTLGKHAMQNALKSYAKVKA
jgi:hypothetical protein